MPTFERRIFVARAVRNFLRQQFSGCELIVLDDGDDGTSEVLPRTSRIRYYRSPKRLSIGAKRNWGCEIAAGDIIAHWDDDDYYAPYRLGVQVQAIASGADLTGSSCLFYWKPSSRSGFIYRYTGGLARWVAGNTLAYRRAIWETHPFADVQVREDLRFMWEASAARVRDLRDPGLCVATIHEGNVTPKETGGQYWHAVESSAVLGAMKSWRPAQRPFGD